MKRIIGNERIKNNSDAQLYSGITLLCFMASILYFAFGIFYSIRNIPNLEFYTYSQALVALALYIYCRQGSPLSYKLAYVVLCISVMLLHILLIYTLGDVGSSFIAMAAIMPNHLFNILKPRFKLIFDAFLLLCVNIGFWVGLNTTPLINLDNLDSLKFCIMNLCILFCFLELYLNLMSQKSSTRMAQEVIAKTSEAALFDELTKLGNRRLYNEIKEEVETAEKDPNLVVVVMDIDFFKQVNDTYGHHTGDAVLVFIADSMKKMFRQRDIMIRWGGEEFLLLFWHTNVSQVKSMMVQFRHYLSVNPVRVDGLELSIKVTTGIKKHKFGTSLDETVAHTDKLMYQGKMQGRDQIVVDPADS